MDVPHIVQPHDTGQCTGAFYCQPVVEHLDLDIRPFDAVIAVCNGVDNQLFPRELRVFRLGDKTSICAEIGAFLDLATHELQRFFNDMQNASLKHHVFDNVHLCADLGLCALVSDKADARTWKVVHRILTKQQHGGRADFFLAAFGRDKLFVLPQIFFRAFAIAEFLRVRSDKIKVNVIYRCIRHWGIFKIPCAFGIHQLEAFFKIEFLGLVPDAEENIVCLI